MIRHFDFLTQASKEFVGDRAVVESKMRGHDFGDYHLMKDFVRAVSRSDPSLILSGPEEVRFTIYFFDLNPSSSSSFPHLDPLCADARVPLDHLRRRGLASFGLRRRPPVWPIILSRVWHKINRPKKGVKKPTERTKQNTQPQHNKQHTRRKKGDERTEGPSARTAQQTDRQTERTVKKKKRRKVKTRWQMTERERNQSTMESILRCQALGSSASSAPSRR